MTDVLDDSRTVYVDQVLPHGPLDTVILLGGVDEDGEPVTVAADHRQANHVIEALEHESPVPVDAPGWATSRVSL